MNTLAISAWVLVITSMVTIIYSGYSPGVRFTVFDENENALGTFVLVSMIGIFWKAIQPSKSNVQVWKLLALLYMIAAITIIAISGSRGSLITLLVTFLAFLFWKPTRSLGKVSFLFLILLGTIAPFLFKGTVDRFILNDPTNTLLGGREALWSAAWLAIKEYPWIGTGIGNSNFEILSYLRNYRSIFRLDYAPVHNPILAIWIETGIPGILLYLGGLVSAIVLFVQQYFKHKNNISYYLLPYFGIVGSVFIGFMFSWIKGGGMESDILYFLMLALLLIPSGLESNQELSTDLNKN